MGLLLRCFFILMCWIPGLPLLAQEEQDAALWTTVNAEKKISKRFSVQLTEEFRLRDNMQRLNLFYTDLGLNWKGSDWFRGTLSYRWINKYMQEGYFSYRHRLSLDLVFRKKAGNYALSYRQRLQAEVRDVGKSSSGSLPEWYSRNRVEVKYNTGRRWQPYASAEFRYQISNPRKKESDAYWHRNRYCLGLQYDLDKHSTIGFYYLIQREFNVSDPQQLYVTGLEYSIQF